MASAKKEINLLVKEQTYFDKFLKWALTVGRWTVITTELIVILCFLSRFKLDRELADLGEIIKQRQTMINSFGGLEEKFRNLQERISTISQLEKDQGLAVKLLDKVSQILPVDTSLTKLAVQEGKVSIAGISLSESGFNSFINGLSSSGFKKISLGKIGKGKAGEIEFSLSAEAGDQSD